MSVDTLREAPKFWITMLLNSIDWAITDKITWLMKDECLFTTPYSKGSYAKTVWITVIALGYKTVGNRSQLGNT